MFPAEGGSICPTYTQSSFSALEPPKGQKLCFHISLNHFQLISAFCRIFFLQITKKLRNLKILLKIAQKWVKFQNFTILTYINILYIKRKHFSCRIQFHREKVWFYARKIEKKYFFESFMKIELEERMHQYRYLVKCRGMFFDQRNHLLGGIFPSIYLLFYMESHELFEIDGK